MNLIGENIYEDLQLMPRDIQGWNYKHPVFDGLIHRTQPKTIIEVGTWKGASAITMGLICKRLNLDTKIYCVDTWLGALEFLTEFKDTQERDLKFKNGYPQIYYQFLSNIVHSGLQDIVIPVPNTSLTAARYFKHHEIKAELIYIDASHEYEDVKADIQAYKELCTGIMFGDDYGWAGVKQAVDETLQVNVIDLNYWIWQQ